jgi:GNAT superfamily N-acetyltransferase
MVVAGLLLRDSSRAVSRRLRRPLSGEMSQRLGPATHKSLRDTGRMDVWVAGQEDLVDLARLLWLHAAPDEQAKQPVESFAVDLAAWWTDHEDSHLAFVARLAEAGVVGMAWLALVPRVPRPGATTRRSADIQSVFVVSEQRGKRIGSALVEAASEHALRLGAGRVTVHSGRKAVPVYERLGFASSRQLLQRPAE